MWDLVPRSRMEPGPPALGAWSLSHWTTREVPRSLISDTFPSPDAPACLCYLWSSHAHLCLTHAVLLCHLFSWSCCRPQSKPILLLCIFWLQKDPAHSLLPFLWPLLLLCHLCHPLIIRGEQPVSARPKHITLWLLTCGRQSALSRNSVSYSVKSPLDQILKPPGIYSAPTGCIL